MADTIYSAQEENNPNQEQLSSETGTLESFSSPPASIKESGQAASNSTSQKTDSPTWNEQFATDLKNFINQTTDKIGYIDTRINDIETKTEDMRVNIINTLGIFVAIFTFVSIQFQLFQSLTSFFQYISLSLILIGALIIFIVFLDYITKKKIDPKPLLLRDILPVKNWTVTVHRIFFIVSMILIFIGILIGISSPKSVTNTGETDSKIKIIKLD